MKIRLKRVRAMPARLEPGVLYVSEEFETAAHLCACGCGSKVRTPLAPTEWKFTDHPQGPSLYPSIGNWQRPCKSHYWIRRGEIEWSTKWTSQQIATGRAAEDLRREIYYAEQSPTKWWIRVISWLKSMIGR